jgi:phosphoribosylglycinamide formyltransferase 1
MHKQAGHKTVTKLKLAVLISGRGSNLQALIESCSNSDYPAQIVVVVSNNPDAPGLARAVEANIPAMICDHAYFNDDKTAFEEAIATIIEQHDADLICLAGFMRILSPVFINRFKDRIINIHPSLLPAYKGLNTHEKVLASGDTIHGCSVHVVTTGVDEGAVIAQKTMPVLPQDTPESLAKRLLTYEHTLYSDVVADIATGHIVIRQGRIERPSIIRHYSSTKKESTQEIPMNDHSHAPHTPFNDPESIAKAEKMWSNFTKATIIAGAAIVFILIVMAAVLI